MPTEYGDCCAGALCKMPNRSVTFYHRCIVCGGFLHVPCEHTDIDDNTTCVKCYPKPNPFGGKSPRKMASTARGDSITSPTVEELEIQDLPQLPTVTQVGGEPEESPGITTRSNRQKQGGKEVDGTGKASPAQLPPPAPPPKTTSRKKQKRDGAEVRIGLGKRVKVSRGDIFHVLSPNQRQFIPQDIGNSHPLFGKVIGGGGNKSAKKGWDIELDILPCDDNKVINVSRNKLSVLAPGEDEDVVRHLTQAEKLQQITVEEEEKKKKQSPMVKCQAEFAKLSKEVLAEATVFTMTYGSKEAEFIDWETLSDQEYHYDTIFRPPTSSNVVSSSFDFQCSIQENFFEHVFPSVVGHAEIIDKFLSDPRATYHDTVQSHNILFHDANDDDPDWKVLTLNTLFDFSFFNISLIFFVSFFIPFSQVKQCYVLLIAAATELENGVENLWKSGMKGVRRNYPDFGRFMSINGMHAFCSAAPYAWADEKYWYLPDRDTPWEMFLPCVYEFNDTRKLLVKSLMVMLDESMSGWRPKTSKLGGLPNISFEPRKPVPLGTMFRNGADCMSGVLVFQDVVQAPESQSKKNTSMNLLIYQEIHQSPRTQLRYFVKLKGLKSLKVVGLAETHGLEVSCLLSKSW